MALIIALVVMSIIAAALLAKKPGKRPSRVEPVGSFEILTWEIRYTTGWNEGPLRRATTETYSLNFKGEPFSFVGKAGLFRDEERRYDEVNSVITFPSPEPALVINVGDPNNRSFYYLLREADGRPQVDLLGESSGSVAADWLDPLPGKASTERHLAVHRAHLEGGRFILLGDTTVLDTKTLEWFRAEPSSFVSPAGFKPPIEMSPDGRSFVRLGYDGQDLRVIVYDFVGGRTYTLPVDRSRMRYTVIEEIDAAWLEHHFEWTHDDEGHDRLQTRADFALLPHKGRLTTDPHDSYREYRIEPIAEGMQPLLVSFLEKAMQGELQPRREYSSADELLVRGRKVSVMQHDDQVMIWMDRGSDSTMMIEIADALDRQLAAGEWDRYFLER